MIKALHTPKYPHAQATDTRRTNQAGPVIQTYSDRSELKEQLKNLDQRREAEGTVMLLLDSEFDGHLPSLIRRQNPGRRIIVTSKLGYLPGLVSRRDIAFRAGMLGWTRISFVHDFDDAMDEARAALSSGERIVILKPEHAELSQNDFLGS